MIYVFLFECRIENYLAREQILTYKWYEKLLIYEICETLFEVSSGKGCFLGRLEVF